MTTKSPSKTAEKTSMRERLSRIFGHKKLKPTEQFEAVPNEDLSLRTISRKQGQSLSDLEFRKQPQLRIYQKCASRLALLDTAEREVFLTQLNMIKMNMPDYPLNYIWVVWEQQRNTHEHKTTTSLTSKNELKTFIISSEPSLQMSQFSIHVMKKDLKPSRSSPMLRDKMTLVVKVPFGCEMIWSKLLKEVTTEADPQIHICGLSWRTKREKKYSLMTIWLMEKMEQDIANEVMFFLRTKLPHFIDVVDNSVMVDNDSLQTFSLKKSKPRHIQTPQGDIRPHP